MWAFLWIKLWQGLWWLYVPGTRGYYVFSKFMQLFSGKPKKFEGPAGELLTSLKTVDDVADLVSDLEYKPDPLWGLFDYFRHPRTVWARLTRNGTVGKGNYIGDCDDWAALVAWLLPAEVNPTIMNVFYLGTSGRPGGHNVCVLESPEGDGTYWHMSNWRVGYTRGRPAKGYASLEAVATGVAGQGQLVGWCLTDPNLRRIKWGFRGEE